ncbi:MAG: hypothetical protein J6Y64_04640 [Ruminococcus sp.]|nr:hypothetical protein [Ruminococcus sp.]
MMSRKEWGYDMLIALLREHDIDESLAAEIKAIRTVAEKEENNGGDINTDRRNCSCGYIGNADNTARA